MDHLEENPMCEKTHASFRLFGPELDKHAVSAHLGIQPHFAANKHELRPSRTRSIRQQTGLWYITTDDKLATTNLERHLIYLLEILEPRRDELLEMMTEQSIEADFFCYWVAAKELGGGPQISPGTLKRIADLNAPLGFDFYGHYV